MADSIKVGVNGDNDSGWESAFTLRKAGFIGRVMVEQLYAASFRTFDDPREPGKTRREWSEVGPPEGSASCSVP